MSKILSELINKKCVLIMKDYFFLIATDSIIIPVAYGDIASIRGAVLFK